MNELATFKTERTVLQVYSSVLIYSILDINEFLSLQNTNNYVKSTTVAITIL